MKLSTLLTLSATALAAPLSDYGPDWGCTRGKSFQQFGQIIFENTDFATAEANAVFEFIQNYKNNRLLSQMYAVEHPSLPNYLAMISGTTFGVKDDSPPARYNFTGPTIIDLLESKGISWKMYAEDYPGNCFTGPNNSIPHSYAAKHVPAIYFQSVTLNPERCAKIVPATEFEADFESGNLPQWWYYVPNLLDDGHDTNVTFMASYLTSQWIPRFQNPKFTKDLAMVITFDENDTDTEPNHIYAALIGDALMPMGPVDDTIYTHFSLMKTVEDNWDLGCLNRNDTTATSIII